mgnify:CR=1 FL=1
MRQSQLFTKTIKEAPKDEMALNAKLLERAGFVYKNSSGVYSFLPLGWRVLRRIADVIRQEMDRIGGQEMLMAALHDKRYLRATGRWDVDVIYKVITAKEKRPNFNISWTHEEIISEIAQKYVNSYKDLPFAVYQIQTKFRAERRAKSGILRGREFLMKDLYSFHASEEDLMGYYGEVASSYQKVFKRCGLKAIYTLAPGGDFTAQNTHEFQVISEVGEDTIYVCLTCQHSENKEISKLKKGQKCPKCGGKIDEKKSIEVGNIFPLGVKYSKAFDLQFVDKKGNKKYVLMGSYGIGLSRTMGAVVEIHHDKKGIIWPKEVAPFQVHLIRIENNDKVKRVAEKLYQDLQKKGYEVLYDDRESKRAGEKFMDADLIGIPIRVVISERTLKKMSAEVKKRDEQVPKLVKISQFKINSR